MDYEQLRTLGAASINHGGVRVDVIPSGATRPVTPTVRAEWELRGAADPDVVYGYIDVLGARSAYAFTTFEWENEVLGSEVSTLEDACSAILRQ